MTMADPDKYHGLKVVDMRQGEIRSTIRRAFNRGLQDCRNVIVIIEGQAGGVYVEWSSVDVMHSLKLLGAAQGALQVSSKDRA